ncbi:hypothetical protein OF83DRAFT_512054 [Amylostereum chailletii]|nr:hypothetical protein OF83DRAFT_512054 [Amylostereum chailletii]
MLTSSPHSSETVRISGVHPIRGPTVRRALCRQTHNAAPTSPPTVSRSRHKFATTPVVIGHTDFIPTGPPISSNPQPRHGRQPLRGSASECARESIVGASQGRRWRCPLREAGLGANEKRGRRRWEWETEAPLEPPRPPVVRSRRLSATSPRCRLPWDRRSDLGWVVVVLVVLPAFEWTRRVFHAHRYIADPRRRTSPCVRARRRRSRSKRTQDGRPRVCGEGRWVGCADGGPGTRSCGRSISARASGRTGGEVEVGAAGVGEKLGRVKATGRGGRGGCGTGCTRVVRAHRVFVGGGTGVGRVHGRLRTDSASGSDTDPCTIAFLLSVSRDFLLFPFLFVQPGRFALGRVHRRLC